MDGDALLAVVVVVLPPNSKLFCCMYAYMLESSRDDAVVAGDFDVLGDDTGAGIRPPPELLVG